MTTSICTEELRKAVSSDPHKSIPSNITCEYLKTEHGITLLVQQDGFILTRPPKNGRPLVKASVSKLSGALIGPLIATLDHNSAEGLAVWNVSQSIDECALKTSDFEWKIRARMLLSNKDIVGVIIMIASKNQCALESLSSRVMRVMK